MAMGGFSQQFSNEIQNRLVAEMDQRAEQTIQAAQRLAPRKTDYLANSIGYTLNKNDYKVEFFVLAEYGLFQEYGTRNIPAHPYLRPAINEVWARSYGFETGMNFRNVPKTDEKIVAYYDTFALKRGLTRKQRSHILKNLKPVSKYLYSRAGRRHTKTTLTVRHF